MPLISISKENTLSRSRLEHKTQLNSRVYTLVPPLLVRMESQHTSQTLFFST